MKHLLQRKLFRLHVMGWLFSLSLLTGNSLFAQQLTGTITVPTSLYPTIAIAVDSLNLYGVGTGGVIVNIAAGTTETAPVAGYKLNATGTATNPIIIRKDPGTVGANPLITSFVGTSTTLDGVFFLLGSDYVTIDGIDIVESGANSTATTQMEWGYALLNKNNAAPFNGCNNNTIKNSTITLNRTNANSRGIYLNHHIATSVTALTITAVGDAHSNNAFYGNKIQNVWTGIFMNGFADANFTLRDMNNDIGGSSYATADTIITLGLGSASGFAVAANGVYMANQMNPNVSYCYIDNALGGSAATATATGIYATSTGQNLNNHFTMKYNYISMTHGAGAVVMYCANINNYDGNVTVTNNDIKLASTGLSSSNQWGIYLNNASAAIGAANFLFKNNTAQNITVNNSAGAIVFFNTGTVSHSFQDISFNTVNNITRTGGTTGGLYGFYTGTGSLGINVPGSITNVYNNTVSNITMTNTAASIFYGIHNAGNATASYYNNVVSNVSSGTTGTVTIYGMLHNGGGDINVYDNTISGLTGSRDVYGFYGTQTSKASAIYNNKIYDLTASGGAGNTASGIYLAQIGQVSTNIYNNRIYRISQISGGASTAQGIVVINGGASITTSSVPLYVYNNAIGNIKALLSNVTATPSVIGINITATTNPLIAYVRYNNVYLSDTASATTHSAAIYQNYAGSRLFLNNNLLVNNTYHPAGTGNACGLMRSGTVLTNYELTSGNNLIYAGTPSARNVIFFDGVNKDSAWISFKSRVYPREAASVSQNITMFNASSTPPVSSTDPHYLQNDTTVASLAESGALNIAGITTDIRGVVRQGNPGYAGTGTRPDIGAFESGGLGINMIYDDVLVAKNTANALIGSVDQPVVDIQVFTSGNSNPVSATQFTLSTSGSTNAVDIAKAKVYYTGSSANFSTATPFGSVVVSPSGAFTITGSQPLFNGLNHFWLAYDITPAATVGNVVDATVTNVIVGAVTKVPSNGNPIGGKTIAAPLNGTYTVGIAPYMTLLSVINDLNTNGVSGNVTVNVPAGFTEAAPAGGYVLGSPILNGTTGANRRVTFQKSGAGVNPLLSSPLGTSASLDGIFTISGTDYITINAIDLVDTNTVSNVTMMEWGYGLIKATTSSALYDGCQNVTIKNSTITMRIGNPLSAGIYTNNHIFGDATQVILTNTSETNSYNTFIGNTIQNVNTGILLRGYGVTANNYFPDMNNTVGDSLAGNNISNFGGGAAGFGINAFNNANISIRFNTIDNAMGGVPASGAQIGIQSNFTYSSGPNMGGANVSNNDVTITIAQSFAGATMNIGVHNTHGKVSINNNNVKWLTAGTGAGTNASFTGIGYNITGGSSYMADVLLFQGNTCKDFTFTTSGTTTFKAFSVLGSARTEDISYDSIYNITRIAGATPAGTITLFDNYTTNNPSAANTPGVVRNIHHNYIVGYNNGTVTTGSLTALNIGNAFAVNVYNNRISSIVNGNVGNTVYGINASSTMLNFTAYNNIIDTLTGGTGSTYGLALANGYGLVTEINNNTIANLSAQGSTNASHAVAMLITNGGRNAKIFNNRIYNIGTTAGGAAYASGVLLVNMAGIANLNQAPLKIYNNLISGITNPSGTSNPSVTGISIAYVASTTQPNAQLYNNTISLSGTTANNMHSAGIFTMNTSTGMLKLANNIVLNNITPAGTGNATVLYRGAVTLVGFDQTSNNNIYWAGTPSVNNLIYFDGTNKDQTITAYKTRVYPRESASESQNVTMISTTGTDAYYLYPDSLVSTSIANAGVAIAGNTADYRNNNRSATTPDIGAYEGNFNPGDITPPSVTVTPLTNAGVSLTSVTLTATIKDLSGTPSAASGNGPRVYFKKQGGAYTSDPGVLTSGTLTNGVWTFTIASASVGVWAVADTISYYVVAQDNNSILGSGPYGVTGSGVSSVLTDPTPFKFVITNGLSGTYTVCPTGCDFTSLSNTYGAFDSINKSSLVGNVTLSINGDLLSETGAVGINSVAQPGNFQVMIVPGSASEKLIVGSAGSGAGIVNFNGGDNITVDGRFAGSGKYLRFRNRNTGGSTVRWYNDAQRDTVRYVYLEGITTAVATAYFSSPATGGTGNDFNALMYCEIRDTLGNGIDPSLTLMNVPNSAIYSDGHLNSSNTIAYNNCYNYIYQGVFLAAGRELHDNWTIHQNAFYQQPAVQAKSGNASIGGSSQQAILISSGEGHTITNNSIGGSAPDRSGLASKSLYLSNFSIGYSGIVLSTYLGIDQLSTVSGNIISNIDANPTQTTNQFCGILVQSGKVDVLNNTVGGGAMPYDTIKEGSYSTGNAGGIVLAGGILNVNNNTIGNISNYVSSNATTTTLRTVGISVPGGAINSPYVFSIVNNTIRDMKSNYYYSTATTYLNPQGTSPVGILTMANLGVPINIEGNTIYNITNTNNTGVSAQANGITLRGGTCTVQRNRIYDINTSGTGSGSNACGIYGIEVINNSTFGNVIKNNQVSLTPSSTADANVFGIMDGTTASSLNTIANNSVYIGGSSTGNSNSYALLTGATASNVKVDIKNNILFNNRTSATTSHFAAGAYVVSSVINPVNFGYNLMVTPSATTIIEAPSGTSMNAADVNAMYTAKSSNSNWIETSANVSAAGLFNNTTTGNLSLNAANAVSWYANGKALPMATVTNDFANASRSTAIATGASDIGSSEVTPSVAPASAVASAAPAANTTTNYTYGNRVVASVNWGAAGTVPTSLDVKYYSGTTVPSVVAGKTQYNAYYSVTPTGGTGYTYSIALAYDSAVMGNVESHAASRMVYFKSPTWTWLTSSAANNTTGLLSSGGTLAATTLPANFTGTSINNPLPVTLVKFAGVAVQGDVQLGWTTANEVNNLGFEVERSVDGRNFRSVGFVSGAGNSSKPMNYTLIDDRAFKTAGTTGLYYRLKQVDMDGRSEYSEMIYVAESSKETIEVSLYPNPATDVVNISAMIAKQGTMDITVMDLQGRVVSKQSSETLKGMNTITVDPSSFNGMGIYFVKVTVEGETKVMKLIKH